jgi:hypothetical protein
VEGVVHLSSTDRVMGGLACAYICYRVISAVRTGIYYGDGDRDVDVARNPVAFALTIIMAIVVALLFAVLVLSPNHPDPSGSDVQLHGRP